MILTKDLLGEELLTTFTVIKVHYEPLAESEWTLQFENYPPITYFDKCFDTIEEDEKLIGKKIKAQIDLFAFNDNDISLITNPSEQKKIIYYDKENGDFVATGIYFDDSKEIQSKYGDVSLEACLDSVFRIHVLENLGGDKFNFKKGEWVKVKTSERCIILARDYMPLPE